jgi:hypothetical protein
MAAGISVMDVCRMIIFLSAKSPEKQVSRYEL